MCRLELVQLYVVPLCTALQLLESAMHTWMTPYKQLHVVLKRVRV